MFFSPIRLIVVFRLDFRFCSSSNFSFRRASVIRGQIFYKKHLPLNGVRVQVFNQPNQGYTISDKDGV